MPERLRRSDLRFIAICLAMLAGTVWFSVRNFYRAFPEASIDFRVNRQAASSIAGKFLSDQGYRLGGYREASRFSFDDQAKTFLEREIGLERANQIMQSRLHLWRWSYRWFRPQQKEEYRIDIATGGEVVGFQHEIAESEARPSLTPEQARAMAEEFLRKQFHRDLGALEFVEASSLDRPARTDQVFTWKERDFSLKDATYRVEVTILGNEPGGYSEYLKVPDQWSRDYERLRSRNEVTQYVDTALVLVLLVGMIATIALRVRRHDVKWNRAAWVGIIGAGLSFLASWNGFPLREFNYPTTDSYASFVARQLLQSVFEAVAAGGLLFVLTAGAEPLYRSTFGNKISLGNLFRPRGLRTRGFFLGSILGISLTGAFVAYQIAFYLLAYRFGAWSPADVPYSDLLNTRLPWAFVLFGGFFPAVSEEFLFRMFAIPFLRRLVRSMMAALLLAGFLWGFGHAGYPQQPFYIRGLEVGIGGVVLGAILLRWGILPTLVWHYSMDAMYSALLLLRSHSLYFKLSGAASAGIMVLPVLIALAMYLRRGGFEPEAGLTNASEAATVEVATPAGDEEATVLTSTESPAPQCRPLPHHMRLAGIMIFVLGMLSLLVPLQRFGAVPDYRITAEQARAVADDFLRRQGIDTSGFRHIAFPATHWTGDNALAGKYILEHRRTAVASELFESNRPLQHWLVRYYRSLDKEEAVVSLNPETGKVLSFDHTIPEDRPGADLAPEVARPIAVAFASAMGWNLSGMDLKESSSEKMKARRDHTFVWEARLGDPRNVDEAHFRVTLEVAGDRVVSLRFGWKIPEDFTRARSRQSALSIALVALRITSGSFLGGAGIWLLVRRIRKGLVQWGYVIRLAIPLALISLLGQLLSLHLAFRAYDSAIPLLTFQVMAWIGLIIGLVFNFLIYTAAWGLLTSFYPDVSATLRATYRKTCGADAAVAMLLAVGFVVLLNHLHMLLMDRFPSQALYAIASPDVIVSAAPAVSVIASALGSTLVYAAGLAVLVKLVELLPRRWMTVPAGLLLAATLVSGDVRSIGEFVLQYGIALAAVGCGMWFCFYFARRNYLAYALALLAVSSLSHGTTQLLTQPNPALQFQGWLVIAMLAAASAWALLPATKSAPANSATGL
jgi:membrane protease YdiL (CAAX protease family)